MKKFIIFLIVGTVLNSPCVAVQIKQIGSHDDINLLRNEIRKLENQLAQKTETLNKCAEKNKNFQIAGIATIGLTGAGIATNISMYSEKKKLQYQSEQIQNKIQTAETEADNFIQEIEKLPKNLDDEKFEQELNNNLTDTEKKRLQELYDNQFDFGKIYGENAKTIPESDKLILEKIFHAARKSQKE